MIHIESGVSSEAGPRSCKPDNLRRSLKYESLKTAVFRSAVSVLTTGELSANTLFYVMHIASKMKLTKR
jgi:hypothetical protein